MAKRLLCVVLSLLMIMAVLPMGVVADDVTYTSWSSNSLPSSSGYYRLTTNITMPSAPEIKYGTDVTIDLNGYSITITSMNTSITVAGSLTILDSSEAQTGMIIKSVSGRDASIIYVQGGTFTLESGTICTGEGYYVNSGIYSTGGTVIINGGTVSGSYRTSAICPNQGALKITGGEFSNDYNNYYTLKSGTSPVTIEISGGTFGGKINLDTIATNGSCTVTGGTYTTTGYAVVEKYIDTDSYTYIDNENGTYTVTPSSAEVVPTLIGKSLVIGEKVGVRYYYSFDESLDPTDYTVQFTVNGVTQTSELTEYGDYYTAICEVAFYQMTQPITAQLYCGDEAVGDASTNYTVRTYYDNKYSSASEKTQNLLVAMLNFGGYGQSLVGQTSTSLANEGLSMTSVDASKLSDYKASVEKSSESISWGVDGALVLEGSDSACVKFTFSGLGEDCKVTINGTEVSLTDNAYTTDLIRVQNWDNFITVVITNGSETVTLKYSVLSYAYAVLSDTTEYANYVNIATAMYHYNVAAEAYLAG